VSAATTTFTRHQTRSQKKDETCQASSQKKGRGKGKKSDIGTPVKKKGVVGERGVPQGADNIILGEDPPPNQPNSGRMEGNKPKKKALTKRC